MKNESSKFNRHTCLLPYRQFVILFGISCQLSRDKCWQNTLEYSLSSVFLTTVVINCHLFCESSNAHPKGIPNTHYTIRSTYGRLSREQ